MNSPPTKGDAMTEIYSPLLGSLANEFASTFGLFEFALKECGHYDVNPKTQEVQTSWTKFVKKYPHINEVFFEKLKADAATTVIIGDPPKRLRERDGVLGWAEPPSVKDMESLYYAVKRVRNNLFHGDKAHWNPSRDPELIRASLFAVRAIIVEAKEIATIYNQGVAAFALQLR